MTKKTTFAMIALTVIGAALPVGFAASMVLPDEQPPKIDDFAEYGRPMDDHGSAIAYGDLSVFDAVEEFGAAQDVNVPYCDQRAQLVSTLKHDFAEHKKSHVPLEQGRSVELWASEIMGTWTAVYTRSDNVSCVVSSGLGWAAGQSPLALLEAEGILPAG